MTAKQARAKELKDNHKVLAIVFKQWMEDQKKRKQP